MFCEMSDEHVPPATGQSRPADVVGGELGRQSAVQPSQRLETREHLAVACRGCPAPGDDVAPVLAVFTRGAEELLSLGECLAEVVAQGGRVAPGESELVAVERQE